MSRPGNSETQVSQRVSNAKLSELVNLLAHGGSRSRRAARQLERMGPRAVPALLRGYDSTREHLRWEIVNLLGCIKDPRALPLLLDRGIHDQELHPRWRSIWALSSVDDGRAITELRSQLSRCRGRRRRNAAVALSIFHDPAAIPELRRGLTAIDNWTRWESASCLAGYRDAGAAEDILRLYRKEQDRSIRREMVRAVTGVDGPVVFRFLRRRLADADPLIRRAAVYALVQTGDARRARHAINSRLRHERTRDVKKVLRAAIAELDDL